MNSNSDDMSDFLNEPSRPKRPARQFRLIELLTVVAIIGILIALFLPATRSVWPGSRRAQCTNCLKQIALALHNYHTAYDALPPAHTVDATGRPLHSWRTLILPYLEQKSLYDSIDLSKPWNDAVNSTAFATKVSTLVCPELVSTAPCTSYMAVVAPSGCFQGDKPRRFSEITDGLSRTLMVIEVPSDRAVHWMAPLDLDESFLMALNSRSKVNHKDGMNAAFVDGSVRFLPLDLPAAQRRAMISIAGHENEVLEASK